LITLTVLRTRSTTQKHSGTWHAHTHTHNTHTHTHTHTHALFMSGPRCTNTWMCNVSLSPSHITGHASNTATILKRAAKGKTEKYKSAAEAMHATFVPFILTAQCDVGKEALDFLVLLHSKCEKPQPDPRLILSLTIQRAVARAELWAAKRCLGSRFRRGDFDS
jgi:hypothetical protein